jgi:hypothetical protein
MAAPRSGLPVFGSNLCLHGKGPLAAVEWFRRVVESVVGPVFVGASRMDLHVDLQGWDLDGDDRRKFVCRADGRDLYEVADGFSGLLFGRRTSGTVMARIYDKTLESQKKGTAFWEDIWGPERDPAHHVLRVEFEINRQGLKEYGVESAYEAIEAGPAIWTDLTTTWLTYRTPTEDATRSRWPLAPEWRSVQHARFAADALGVSRMRDGRKRGEYRNLAAQLSGYVAKVAALEGVHSIEEALHPVRDILRWYESKSGVAFSARVADKRRELAVS